MHSRRIVLLVIGLAVVAVWQWQSRRQSTPRDNVAPMGPSPREHTIRAFGGGTSDDSEQDADLRRQVVGRWGRSDSDLVYLDFAADGGLRGADMTSDPVAVAEGREPFKAEEYVGRWEINHGWVRLHKPQHILAIRLRFTDDGRLQLFDAIERIDQAWVFHRLPGSTGKADAEPNSAVDQVCRAVPGR
jgi:hypothetical protein